MVIGDKLLDVYSQCCENRGYKLKVSDHGTAGLSAAELRAVILIFLLLSTGIFFMVVWLVIF
jgi:hypothetical protein